MTEEMELVRGSGNIFADFGDPDADAKHLKAQIAAQIIGLLDREHMTVRAAAKRVECDAADIQRIRNADLARFTLDRLIRYAIKLGCKEEIKVNMPKAA